MVSLADFGYMGGVGVFGEVLRTSSWINKLLPRELTVVVVVFLAGDQLAAAEDGHLHRVSMALFTSLRHW